MSAIFQEIWDADQSGAGVPALRPGEPKDPSRGFVVVDERATSVGVDHRVLAEVVIPDAKRETYRLCERLYDNYALERAVRERVTSGEVQEELDLIDAILDTPPIEVAQQYLETSLDLTISKDAMAAMIKETWFAMARAGSQLEASGFEHVFVGEQSSSRSKIGGYHFWHKYHLDDGGSGEDRIEYVGTRYGGAQEPGQGILVPEVVTLQLTWDAPFGDAGLRSGSRTLSKPIGGFFVGCSPEGLIALGLVRCRTKSSKITQINGAEYQLDLHRLDNAPNSIRTFFPRFRRADVVAIDNGGGSGGSGGSGGGDGSSGGTPAGETPFRIVAGMVNPVNPEGGREFLQILNVSGQRRSLENWRIEAPNGMAFTLDDIGVDPGNLFKFVAPTAQGAFRNKAGTILLRDASNRVVQECPYGTEQARREGVPIVF